MCMAFQDVGRGWHYNSLNDVVCCNCLWTSREGSRVETCSALLVTSVDEYCTHTFLLRERDF